LAGEKTKETSWAGAHATLALLLALIHPTSGKERSRKPKP
jgi:hypothetical protein